ncbi:MAG: peptidylprolyl isomerase [Phycisphaerales bacterium]
MARFRNRRSGGTHGEMNPAMFEQLEGRVVLYNSPMTTALPTVGMMENQNDSVMRINTSYGNIDIELFDATLIAGVANFRFYLDRGWLDESFFHARTAQGLFGGLFGFDDGPGLRNLNQAPPITNFAPRNNAERTIALAPMSTSGSTSQFVINLANNTQFNTLNGGYRVIGKVIQGWNVVQAIAGLQTRDLDQALTGSNPNPGTFDAVPTSALYNPVTGPTEATLVRIHDIDLIKPANNTRFFSFATYMPEGFRGSNIIERVDLANLDDGGSNAYEVIVRYESGNRDRVIAFGTLAAGARSSVKVSDFNIPTYNLVRPDVGFSIEVRSTRALSAALDHRNSGLTIGETFQNVAPIGEGALKTWNFGGAERGTNITNYLLFQNLTSQVANVSVAIYPQSGTTRFFAATMDPYRRGTMTLHTTGTLIPTGNFSIQVTSNVAIVSSLTQYKMGGSPVASEGSLALGSLATGRSTGFLAAASVPTVGDARVEFLYTGGSPAAITVSLTFVLSNGTTVNGPVTLLTTAQRRQTVSLTTGLGLPSNQFFSIRYDVTNAAGAVAATYTQRRDGDTMSTPFTTVSTRSVNFADGYSDPTLVPAGMQETISVFNPYSGSVIFSYQLLFRFSDGTTIFGPAGIQSLGANLRRDHRPQDIPAVWNKITSNTAFRFYSVEVISAPFGFPSVTGAVVAQMTRVHTTWGQTLTSLGGLDPRLAAVYMNAPELSQ